MCRYVLFLLGTPTTASSSSVFPFSIPRKEEDLLVPGLTEIKRDWESSLAPLFSFFFLLHLALAFVIFSFFFLALPRAYCDASIDFLLEPRREKHRILP